MGFLSKLFGLGREAEKPAAEPTQYKGYLIYAEAAPEGGQFRIAGRICKEVEGETLCHQFFRSDLLPSADAADELMLSKAQMYIDQMGDRMFN